MGFGRDVKKHHKKYTKLAVKCAWEVDAPLLRMQYELKVNEIKAQLEWVRLAGAIPEPTPALTDKVSGKLGVDWSCNEKLLLHGTRVQRIGAILKDGLNERYAADGTFGCGVYLAEDPSKSDQYAPADDGDAADEETRRAYRVLYEASGGAHPGEVFYAFVCKVCLGYPIHTKGPAYPEQPTAVQVPTSSLVTEGASVFADADTRRQLRDIDGVTPFVVHHALVVETGRDVQRHREFVLFDGRAILPKYLVAYARED